MYSLPPVEPQLDRLRGVASSLCDGVLAEDKSGLAWAAMPQLAAILSQPASHGGGTSRMSGPRNVARAIARPLGPMLVRVGEFAFLATSVQHERVLGPVIRQMEERTGATRADVHPPALGPRSLTAALRRARQLQRTIDGWASTTGILVPDHVQSLISRSSIYQARAEQLVRRGEVPRVLVVATQHNTTERTFLSALSEHCVTVYIPHAPVAANVLYEDLPVHHAILRGQAELDWYVALGASDEMSVGGDPSIESHGSAASPRSDTVVYAASPHPPEVLAADVALILAAGITDVEVCPHPRMRSEQQLLACFPKGWAVNIDTSTWDRLRLGGAAAVIQRDSGVGLEVLRLGIPLIDVRNPGSKANYPYLDSPNVDVVSTSDELRRAISSVCGGDRAREQQLTYAASWAAHTGMEAADRIASQMIAVANTPIDRKPVLDGWIQNGVRRPQIG